ncbi:MAG: 3-phosphoshikimate 1-carboxyvinyltransferase, partial [Solirubrobacterales bacterium]
MTRFDPQGPLAGVLRPPPDKSISHRAAIVAAMGEGRTDVEGYLDAADTLASLEALRTLGVAVERSASPEIPGGLQVRIEGIGLRGPGARWPGNGRPDSRGAVAIGVENAGTLLRMLPGWLAGQAEGSWELDGDESIRRRPVDRVAEPLASMGAEVDCRDGRLPPLRVTGAELRGIDYRLPVASAQVKSSILFAGLLADSPTRVAEPARTRDHTERLLGAAGARIESVDPRTLPTGGGTARRIT